MCSLVLLDVVLRPGAVAGALDLEAGDAERRIVWHPAFRHRPAGHRTQRIEEITLRERCTGLLVDDAQRVLSGQHHDTVAVRHSAVDAFVAVCLAEIFEDVSPRALRLSSERPERGSGGGRAVEIGSDERVDGPGHGARCAMRDALISRRGDSSASAA